HFNVAHQVFRDIGTAGLTLILRFHDLEKGFRVDQGIVDLIVDPVELADGGGHIAEEHNMEHDGPYGHGSVEHKIGGQDDDHYHPDLFQHGFHTVEHKTQMPGLHLVLGHIELDLLVLGGFQGFPGKGLYYRNGIDNADNGVALGLPMGPKGPSEPAEFFGL